MFLKNFQDSNSSVAESGPTFLASTGICCCAGNGHFSRASSLCRQAGLMGRVGGNVTLAPRKYLIRPDDSGWPLDKARASLGSPFPWRYFFILKLEDWQSLPDV